MAEWKKVIVSGSDAQLNQLEVDNGITGSLSGSATTAFTASITETQTSILTNQTVGGLSSGTTIDIGSGLESILRDMLITYIPPTLGTPTMRDGGSNISTGTRDVGDTFTVNTASFSATADDPNGEFPFSSSFTASGADVGTINHYFGDDVLGSSNALSIGGEYTITRATTAGSVTFRIRGKRSDNNQFISDTTRSYAFYWRNYLAASSTVISDSTTAQSVLDNDIVTSQLDTNRTWTATCNADNDNAANYTYIIYPASYGDLSGIIQNGATPVLTAFTKLGDYTVDNANGSSISVRVYQSNSTKAFASGTTLAIS